MLPHNDTITRFQNSVSIFGICHLLYNDVDDTCTAAKNINDIRILMIYEILIKETPQPCPHAKYIKFSYQSDGCALRTALTATDVHHGAHCQHSQSTVSHSLQFAFVTLYTDRCNEDKKVVNTEVKQKKKCNQAD